MPKVTIFVSTIVLHNDKFLVVKEGKNNHNQLDTWNFPAGHVEAGEGLIEAAIREAKEESGYDINIDGVLSVLFKLSTALNIGSGFKTIPCPPPNG